MVANSATCTVQQRLLLELCKNQYNKGTPYVQNAYARIGRCDQQIYALAFAASPTFGKRSEICLAFDQLAHEDTMRGWSMLTTNTLNARKTSWSLQWELESGCLNRVEGLRMDETRSCLERNSYENERHL